MICVSVIRWSVCWIGSWISSTDGCVIRGSDRCMVAGSNRCVVRWVWCSNFVGVSVACWDRVVGDGSLHGIRGCIRSCIWSCIWGGVRSYFRIERYFRGLIFCRFFSKLTGNWCVISTIISWGNWCSYKQKKNLHNFFQCWFIDFDSYRQLVHDKLLRIHRIRILHKLVLWHLRKRWKLRERSVTENYRWSRVTGEFHLFKLTSLNILKFSLLNSNWSTGLSNLDLNDILVSIVLLFKQFSNFPLVNLGISDSWHEKCARLEGEKVRWENPLLKFTIVQPFTIMGCCCNVY